MVVLPLVVPYMSTFPPLLWSERNQYPMVPHAPVTSWGNVMAALPLLIWPLAGEPNTAMLLAATATRAYPLPLGSPVITPPADTPPLQSPTYTVVGGE